VVCGHPHTPIVPHKERAIATEEEEGIYLTQIHENDDYAKH